MILINLLTLSTFIIAYFLDNKFGLNWLKFIPGTLLIYFLPGHNLNSILLAKRKDLAWHTKLPLDVLLSISTLTLLYILAKNFLLFSEIKIILFVLIINVLLSIPAYFYDKSKIKMSCIREFVTSNKSIFIIFSIPFILFAIRIILNPFIYDIDSLLYFDAFKSIIKAGIDETQIFSGREAFPFFMISSHYIAGFDYPAFFKYFTPILFYLSSGILFSFIKDFHKLHWKNWTFLLILSSPMLTVLNEGVRPETFCIALSMPTIVLSYFGIKNNDYTCTGLSLIFALAAFKFHEYGSILLISSALTILIELLVNFKRIIGFVKKNLNLTIVLLVTYLFVLSSYLGTILHLFKGGMTSYFINILKRTFFSPTWDWWFIDNATTIWDGNVSWPGYTAVYYYLYHGIVSLCLFLSLLATYLIFYKPKLKITLSQLALLPLAFFFSSHFFLAEIQPRMGMILMFDRSWPYISLSSIIFSILLLNKMSGFKVFPYHKVLYFAAALSIVSGIIGSIISTTFMGAMVSPKEKKAISSIEKLPDNSLVVSTQRNQNLVSIYGNKQFLEITKSSFVVAQFKEQVETEINSIIQQQRDDLLNSIVLTEINEDKIIYNETILDEKRNGGHISSNEDKLRILKEHAPENYTSIDSKLNEISSLYKKDTYFLYSFAKLDNGILSTRQWWRESSDENNYQFFKNYEGDNVVAKDKNFILLRIR